MPSPAPFHADRPTRPHDHLVVGVGAERFAMPLAAIEEAVEEPVPVALPGAASHCLGVLRWRGRRVPLHDAAPVFGLAAGPPPPVALLFGGDDPVAIVVDELIDVVAIAPEAVRPWSARGDAHRVIAGVVMIEGRIVGVARPEAFAAACGLVTGGLATGRLATGGLATPGAAPNAGVAA